MLGGDNESVGIPQQATVACSKVPVQHLARGTDVSKITSSGHWLFGHTTGPEANRIQSGTASHWTMTFSP